MFPFWNPLQEPRGLARVLAFFHPDPGNLRPGPETGGPTGAPSRQSKETRGASPAGPTELEAHPLRSNQSDPLRGGQVAGARALEGACMVIGVAAVANIRRLHRALRAGYWLKEG